MTNACLGFLLQELGKRCWELSSKGGAVNWKSWVSREKQTRASVTSFLLSKACPALHRKAEGQESAESQPCWGQQSCRSVLLCSGQPWHYLRESGRGTAQWESLWHPLHHTQQGIILAGITSWVNRKRKWVHGELHWPWSAATHLCHHSSCVPKPV